MLYRDRLSVVSLFLMSVHEDQAAAGASTGSSTDPMLRVLDAMKRSEQRMEHRLDLLEAEMHCSQDKAVQRATEKAKREKSYSFQKKGHQEQTSTSRSMSVSTKLQRRLPRGQRQSRHWTRPSRPSGKGLIGERQKLIKIADRSEYGWGVVVEYQVRS